MVSNLKSHCRLTEVEPRVGELRKKLIALYDTSGHAVHEDVLRFCYHLEEKYETAKDCMLFLLIIGGTLPATTSLYDFPGTDSVEGFLNALHAKYHCADVGVA